MSAWEVWSRVVPLLGPIVITGCTPTASPPPSAPVGDAGAICATLRGLGCAEGAAADCSDRVALGLSTEHRINAPQAACIANATSKPGARACAPDYIACP